MKKTMIKAVFAAALAGLSAWGAANPAAVQASAVDDALARAAGSFDASGAKPEPTKPQEPVKQKPAKPEPAKPQEPVKQKPAKPEPAKPQEPVKQKPAKPEPTKPQEPLKQKPVKQEAAKPQEPLKQKPAKQEPTKLQIMPPVGQNLAGEGEIAIQSPDFKAIREGNASYQKNDLEAAYRSFNEAVKINGTNSTALINRGVVLRDMKRYDEALRDFEAAQKLEPGLALIEFEMALVHIAQNNAAEAMTHLSRSIDLQPDNSATYMYRAAVERKLGKLKEAVEDYTRSIEKGTEGDNHLRAYIERGITKEQMKDFAGAAADYTTALQIDEKSPAALNGRGVVYDKLGKYEEAVADFSKLLTILPPENTAVVYLNRAGSYRNMKRYGEAIDDFTHALEKAPDNLTVYVERALTYRMMERHEEALADLDKAVSLQPGNADLLNLRAIEKIKLQKAEGALKDLDEAIRINGTNPAFYANRAGLLENQGERERAIADYSAALRLDPSNVGCYYRRGYLYKRQGMTKESEADYKAALALQPDLPAYE